MWGLGLGSLHHPHVSQLEMSLPGSPDSGVTTMLTMGSMTTASYLVVTQLPSHPHRSVTGLMQGPPNTTRWSYPSDPLTMRHEDPHRLHIPTDQKARIHRGTQKPD